MSQQPSPEIDEATAIGRRRVPRRLFEAPVGILLHGKYTLQRSFQVGEGGMMISSAVDMNAGELLALSFFLPGGVMLMVRGVVRSVLPAKDNLPKRYGIEFVNLDFQHKRGIRNFVAAATSLDSYMGL